MKKIKNFERENQTQVLISSFSENTQEPRSDFVIDSATEAAGAASLTGPPEGRLIGRGRCAASVMMRRRLICNGRADQQFGSPAEDQNEDDPKSEFWHTQISQICAFFWL